MVTINPIFAWPSEVRSAAMVEDYAALTYREQWLMDVQTELERLKDTHEKTIDQFYKVGGLIEKCVDDEGRDLSDELVFAIGSTHLVVDFDRDMWPVKAIHFMDLLASPVTEKMEIEMICDVIKAIVYRDAPDKGILAARMGRTELRNAAMVNGIDDLAQRVKADTILLNNAFSGARIERVDTS